MNRPRNLRIAFLSPEFVTESNRGGGLANYLNRMTKALASLGHTPELFTLSANEPGVIDHEGMRVERVAPASRWWIDTLQRASIWSRYWKLPVACEAMRAARGLADALERRHREAPFDAVQAADFSATGLFVKRRSGRTLLARSSWARDLFERVDGRNERFDLRWLYRLERMSMRRADVAYAPSRFVADYFHDRYGLSVRVIRPPVLMETTPDDDPPFELPPRYLVHFGQIGTRKGSDWLARALPLAWRQEPDLTMIWAGRRIEGGHIDRWRKQLWGDRGAQVIWPGAVEKAKLYGILQRAVAAVLPSRVDNLPNTVIESLMLGVGVIGTRGASIDELVEDGVSGELAPLDDDQALADALVRAWRGEAAWQQRGFQPPKILEQMRPETVAAEFVRLVDAGKQGG